MKNKKISVYRLIFCVVTALLLSQNISYSQTITPPSGYTTYYGLAMWAQGATPGATALNNNSIAIDAALHAQANLINRLNQRTINGHVFDADVVITKSDLGIDTTNYGGVPLSRTINGKALSSNITITKSDLGIDTTNYGGVPLSRTINGKALTANITLVKSDLGIDTTNYALSSRTINSYPLTSNVTLTKSDIGLGNVDNTSDGSKTATLLSANNSWTGTNSFYGVTTKALNSAPSTLSGTLTTPVDWSLSNTFTKTLSTSTTITFTNSTSGQMITIALTNTAAHTVDWPAEILWTGGVKPDQTTGAHTDVYTIIKIGSTFYGSVIQNF